MASAPAIAPRLLRQADAAAYCSLSDTTFLSLYDGPVVETGGPGGGARLRRYDVRDLDAWIDRLKGAAPGAPVKDQMAQWLDRLGKKQGVAA